MISLAAAPVPLSRRPAPPVGGLNLDTIAFFGRSFSEYLQIFDLDVAALKRRPVLDVGAGPSSFTAEACRAGIDAVAVDPLYQARPEVLAPQIEADFRRMQRRMREHPELFRVGPDDSDGGAAIPGSGRSSRFGSFASADRDRKAASQRFLEDYAAHRAHGRYFGAALPHLPFLDRAFDVVLCGHLLFLHRRHFDAAFHLAACRELVRVSRDEVRIHPFCGADGQPYPEWEELRGQLADDGIASRIIELDHEFFIGAHETLVLTRA